ncbi:MAG: Organic solvent tolerance protein OstA [Bacteroidetes bacterium]|nr:Organic solvent tolerance protein OstA [Bacteroidota bacterium]
MHRLLFILLFLSFSTFVSAQKKIKFIHADDFKGSVKNGIRFERAIGNVEFEQNTTKIKCDSSYFFRGENRLEAFGHVHIIDDSVDITSLRLDYDGNKKIARLRQQVVFEKTGVAKLFTDFLDYDRIKNEARYFNGGKLVDTTNTLTSRKGYYDVRTNLASFKKEVVGVNKDYTLSSDTLQYNSKTRIVYFRDLTKLVDKEGKTAIYEHGIYDTRKKTSTLSTGEMETPSYKIKADYYDLDDLKKYYKVKGHVAMTSKNEDLTVFGEEGYLDKKSGFSKVWNNAYVAKVDDAGDTLFLSADTLVSIDSQDPKKKRLLAYHNVKIFKSDMQGKADSLAYVSADSTLFFYRDPVLWSDDNQMTADSIRMLLKNKKIDRIYMVNNSFVASEDSLKNFNQIKGKKMNIFFKGKNIDHVIVEGNGESLYHALEEKLIKKDTMLLKITFLVGMNKMICSNIRINFKNGKVSNVNSYIKPDASFFPPHEIKEKDRTLKGFAWREKIRPKRLDVVKNQTVSRDKKPK